MIVFLYGPDSYRRLERKRFYIEQFEKKYGKPARSLDLLEENSLAELIESGSSAGLFGGKDLFVVENAYEAEPKKLAAAILIFAENKDRSLLLSEDSKPVKALGVLLKKPVVSEEIDLPEGAAWPAFIKKEAATRSVVLDAAAAHLLAAAYRRNTWGLVTELDKLSNLKKTVTAEMLLSSGVEEPEDNYFALINGLRSQRGAVRLGTLETLLSMGEPAAKIFNMIGPMWTDRLRQFAEYDGMVKGGKFEYEEALADAVLE